MSTPTIGEGRTLDLAGSLPTGRVVIEASAGTGKTFTLTALLVRHIVERSVPIDQVLVVTFTRAAANELRDRTRDVLGRSIDVLRTGEVSAELPWMAVLLASGEAETRHRLGRAEQALASFDDATITTIHGFCQQALAMLGVRSGVDPDSVFVESLDDVIHETCRDLLLDALGDDPGFLSAEYDTNRIETVFRETVRTVLSNPGAQRVPAAGTDELADRWLMLVDRALAELRARLARRRAMSYDQLITGMRDALAHPQRGPAVAAQLAARYAVVLVDEFQDTDPVQWEVFERAFGERGSAERASGGPSLVTVGDPKQAIYRFRGADVHAYLGAVEGADAHRLTVNYRSDPSVLDGVGCLLEGAELGDPRIRFRPVEAAHRGRPNDSPAVVVRTVPDDKRLLNRAKSALAMPAARNLVLADLANRVIELLTNWQPGEIAVLVPSHADAASVADALRRARVPAARTRTGSVLDSEAVLQWQLLLAAIAQPSRAPLVRAAALGWLLPTNIDELGGPDADTVVAALQARCGELAWQLTEYGVAAFFDSLRATDDVTAAVLGRPDGQRALTDLEHIAELLAEHMHGAVCEPAAVLRALDELRADDDPRLERTMRRIDSDSHAVQITTIHAAKGLEYPVVLLPFGFKARPNKSMPRTFSTTSAGLDGGQRRTIDVASLVPWRDDALSQATRDKLSDLEIAGDQLRLLYVALTRAQHRLELWWANTWRAGSSALGAMLLDRVGAEPNRNTPAYSRKNDAKHLLDATAQIESLVEASDGALGLVRLPAQTTPKVWSGGGVVDERLLEVASVGARAPLADPAWRTWSFTAVSTVAGDAHRPAEVPVAGGLDEPADEAFTSLVDEVAPAYAPPGPPASEPMPLDAVRGGAAFGTLVHAVLEHVDFAASNLDHELRMACDREQQRSGVDVDPAVVAAGLRLSVDTPLGHSFGDRRLREFAASDRLTEVSFDLPLQRVDAADIGRVLAGHLDADDPVRTFAVRLSAELSDVGLAGWMTGSIDALLRVREPSGGTRFVVVDYKTNRLHPLGAPDPRSWYGRNEMHAAMVQHRYPLQAVLYLVAVHRFLGVRLGSAYDPDRHLGGAAYLFVRGMVGAGTPADAGARHGVYHWHPPSAAIVAVDDLLAGRR